MPTDEFLAMLVKRKAASGADIKAAGPEAEGDSKAAISLTEPVLDVKTSEVSLALVKEKDKKRHRDGSSSRTHHKCSKDSTAPENSATLVSAGKVDSIPRPSVDVSAYSELESLRLCRGYVDKVC